VKTQRLPRVDALHNLYSTPEAPDADRDSERERRRKYERLGWSEAKIARALADSASTHSPGARGLRQDVRELVAGLAAIAGEVRLLVHVYRGSFGDERVESQGTRELRASELRNGAGAEVGLDTVYVIRA
jgi:hypothetical protein